jgi:hypothetical protein
MSFSTGRAPAQQKPIESEDDRVAQVQRVLEQTEVDTKSLLNKKKMTFAEFLKALESKLPADKKITLRLDADGLGNDFLKIASTAVTLEGASDGRKLEAARLLRWAVGQAKEHSGIELDYAIRSNGVDISLSRFAIYRITYDIPARLGRSDATPTELRSVAQFTRLSNPVTDVENQFAEMLTTTIPLRPGESVELINGTKLVVSAAADRHEQFWDLLDQCGRLLDRSAVMNARLFEVDRAFFEKTVAPLFPAKDAPPVVRLDGPTFQKFISIKPLAVSDGLRLRPGVESVFLSRHLPFRTPAGNGVEGVSLFIEPTFSANLRFIRLKITQKSTQLVGVKKIQVREERDGGFLIQPGEAPDLRTSTTTGVVQIPEMEPILMRLDYRPAGQAGNNKFWVMVARPMIWIDREARERYLGEPQDSSRVLTAAEVDRLLKERGITIASAAEEVWKSEAGAKWESQAAKEPIQATETVKAILQAILDDALRNPKLKNVRDSYGTPGDDSLVIVSGKGSLWPAGFEPQNRGYKLVNSKPEPFSNRPRVLGLRLGMYHAPETDDSEGSETDEAVEIEFFNAGGSGNGAVSGSASLWYSAKRTGKKWVVRLLTVPPQ